MRRILLQIMWSGGEGCWLSQNYKKKYALTYTKLFHFKNLIYTFFLLFLKNTVTKTFAETEKRKTNQLFLDSQIRFIFCVFTSSIRAEEKRK